MRREPSLTFEGALRILGQHEHKTIEKIDKLLGGVILGGGAVSGAVALGVTPLTPVAAFGVVWGWIEQKGLAVDLLTTAIDAVSWRLSGLRGYERRELIAAAHSTIVMASLFESLRGEVGEEFYKRLRITDNEKMAVVRQMMPQVREEGVKYLYTAQIPAPSATCGFEENVEQVARWQAWYMELLHGFIGGLAVVDRRGIDWSNVRKGAINRYQSRYLELSAKIPEFAIWTQLGEHAATRNAVRTAAAELTRDVQGLSGTLRAQNADVVAALNANRDALNRIEMLLSAGTPATRGGATIAAGSALHGLAGLQAKVSWTNAGILGERIIPADRERYPAGLEIPRVDQIYVNPRYRVATCIEPRRGESVRPADERWWKERKSCDNFDVFLARHVTSPRSTTQPLLLLGHPGAGKSLLTKVFAARLPASQYTVVQVPLRRVSADAQIHHQIEEALEISTHQRIPWSDLAEQSRDTVRVVLLDGLDELLQASEHDRSRYLEDVVDFQEREAMQRRPVVVIVTSRTVVADRVRVPDGTTIVKLDPFNGEEIAHWLKRWQRVNADAIAAGTVGELTANTVLRQPELAEQPLLLLMLALYAADLELPQLDAEVATAELYWRLLAGFARREAGKDLGHGHDPAPDELERRTRDHLDRLAVAALGMFNRGRQDISEEELGKDLEALEPQLMQRAKPVEAGQRIIGEFFFVHAPEARTTAGEGARGGQAQRAYEFLHATFAEYLVARRVMDELVDAAVKSFSGRRGPAEPDDDRLFALLSHQEMAVRQSMLDFAREIFADLDEKVRLQVLDTLDVLVRTYRNRHGSDRYVGYRPVPPDQVRQLACYSANLVALRVLLEPRLSGIPLTDLLRVPRHAVLGEWRVTPLLWRSGLDTDGLRAMLALLAVGGSPPRLYVNKNNLSTLPLELWLARLIGDETTETRLRYGTAIKDGVTYYLDGTSWLDIMRSWLVPAIAGINHMPEFLPAPPEGTPEEHVRTVAELIFKYLRSSLNDGSAYIRVLQLLFKMPAVFTMDGLALTAAVIGNPHLRDAVPELQNFEIYGYYAEVVRRVDRVYLPSKSGTINWKDPSNDVVRAFEHVLKKPQDYRKDHSDHWWPTAQRSTR